MDLIQGNQYNLKYKHNKHNNKHNKHKKCQYIGKEGFDGSTDVDNDSTDSATVSNLQAQMTDLLTQLQAAEASTNTTVQNYITDTSRQNKFLNKNIVFSNGQYGYVTGQAVLRLYSSVDIYQANLGVNGCPGNAINADFPWPDPTIVGVGQIITTKNNNIQLTMGTPINNIGESCGNEGTNVFVNSLINNPVPTYQGCYADNLTNPVMTYLGNKPPSVIGITNGNFNEPQLANNTWKLINDSSTVPGWTFNAAALTNNSLGWGYKLPYPEGNQSVSLQNLGSISQTINLNPGSYTLSWNSIGRPVGGGVNPIMVTCTSSTPNTNSNTYTYTPQNNSWDTYSTTIYVSSTGISTIMFAGTNASGDKSSAIQNVSLLTNTDNGNADYTYGMCEQAAIQNGYQYFALQHVNSQKYGYCGLSNDNIKSTKYGNSTIPTNLIPLWSSKTTGSGNYAQLTNTGSLVVTNSTGSNIFSTPATTKELSNYIGCYQDHSSSTYPRSMNQLSTTLQTLDQCNQLAINQNMSYYAIQALHSTIDSSNNTIYTGTCFGSNDLPSATKYGTSTNCAAISSSDSRITGRGWSNAIYNNSPDSNFFLILQDDGNMCIYLGSGPTDNQGFIWNTGTNGKYKDPNPNMVASKSKYGLNYMVSSSENVDNTTNQVLYPGDFIASSTGTTYLIMQEDGNLVLYATIVSTNCKLIIKHSNTYGGGIGANALYNLNKTAYPNNMKKYGYIDAGSNLLEYPQDMINNIHSLNTDQISNSLRPISYWTNGSITDAQTACSNNSSCNQFIISTNPTDPYYNQYLLCTGGITDLKSYPGFNTYIQTSTPNPNSGCNKKVVNIDSVQWENYLKGSLMSPTTDCSVKELTNPQTKQVTSLRQQLADVSNQLIQKLDTIQAQNNSLNTQMSFENEQLLKNVSQYKINAEKILSYSKEMPSSGGNSVEGYENAFLNNIVSDSNINSTQGVYSYIIWSIIATIMVVITIDLMFLNNQGTTLKILLFVSVIIIIMNALFREYALYVNILIIIMFILTKIKTNKQIPE